MMIHPLKIFFIKLKHIGIHKLFGQSFEGDTKRKSRSTCIKS